MGDRTGIEWTDATWNPIVGCSVVSPGCTHCYAMRQAHRLAAMSTQVGAVSHYDGLTVDTKAGPVWNGVVRMAPEGIITRPLRWRRPRMIFVNSMSDLFHPAVPDAWRDRVLMVMAMSPQHTFQVLTKRADIMREYLSALVADDRYVRRPGWTARDVRDADRVMLLPEGQSWPLPNVWWGVSVEDQPRTGRLIDLAHTPAAVRWASLEPLVGGVNLREIDVPDGSGAFSSLHFDALTGWYSGRVSTAAGDGRPWPLPKAGTGLDWMVIGGESGPRARPMNPDWVLDLLAQRAIVRTPALFKQWGEWAWVGEIGFGGHGRAERRDFPPHSMIRVGKKTAGRTVRGVLYDEYPKARAE